MFFRLVRLGVSLRAASRVLGLIAEASGLLGGIPHWTTGRMWLLRVGHAVLTFSKKKAADWAWMIDHSVQIGQEKVLVILGIRLKDLPPAGECLRHEDMQLIALTPRKSWTRKDVDDELEAATAQTGVPRVIVDDHGVDLTGGVSMFQKRHAETAEIYDAKHKAACVLKHRLEKDLRWQAFQQRIGQTRCAIQQTELAFLVPPAPKPKSRFMNLQPVLDWTEKVLAVLRHPPGELPCPVSAERLREKLGWLEEFRVEVQRWSQWQQIVNVTVEFVDRHGLYAGVADDLRRRLPLCRAQSSESLAEELIAFVGSQGAKAFPGERLPGSTEVLESSFGLFKALEKQQSRGGFTSLLLGFGALLAKTSQDVIYRAMQHSRTPDVRRWCVEHLGKTLFSQRKLTFQACAMRSG
jgi:hypothetical protein